MISLILGRFKPIEGKALPVVLVFSAVMLAVRVWLAMPFWNSGVTKWADFPGGFLTKVSSSNSYLFANEFMLHLPGGPYPMPFPAIAAWLSGAGEIILPILLVLGILTRPAALGILGMTLIIQLTIPGGWPVHLQWTIAALIILAFGPGVFSGDWLARKFVTERKASPAAA